MVVNLRVHRALNVAAINSLPYSLGKSVGRWPLTTSAPCLGHGNRLGKLQQVPKLNSSAIYQGMMSPKSTMIFRAWSEVMIKFTQMIAILLPLNVISSLGFQRLFIGSENYHPYVHQRGHYCLNDVHHSEYGYMDHIFHTCSPYYPY